MNAVSNLSAGSDISADGLEQVVAVRLGGQLVCLPIADARDVVPVSAMTSVPRAPRAVAGLANIRGRILTVLSLADLLDLPSDPPRGPRLALSVKWRGERFGLLVDRVEGVLGVDVSRSVAVPGHLPPLLRRHARRIHPLDDKLMVEIDVASLLDTPWILPSDRSFP